VLNRPQDEEAAIGFADSLGTLFLKTVRHQVPFEAGNIATANTFLREACSFLRDHKDEPGEAAGVPMLYSEPTWRPTGIGWLDAIQSEYYANRAPAALGRWKEHPTLGRTVWGPVVLGRKYAATTALMSFLDGRTHWREYLRHELGRSMVESTTIGGGAKAVLKPFHKPKK